MSTFSKLERDKTPPRVVILQPTAFADDWPLKRGTEVCVGLRFVSQDDLDRGRREAEREALGFYAELRGAPLPPDKDTAIEVWRDAMMMNAVARGTCDPNDVTRPYFEAADDTVRRALTPEGARRLWDELVILHKGSGPSRPVATDDDVARLVQLLSSGVELDDEGRKLCAYLLERFGEEEEVGAATYVAKSA